MNCMCNEHIIVYKYLMSYLLMNNSYVHSFGESGEFRVFGFGTISVNHFFTTIDFFTTWTNHNGKQFRLKKKTSSPSVRNSVI